LLIVTCGITLVGALALSLGYNKVQTSYESNFSYNSPSLSIEQYSDGTDFHYQDLISEENLLNVQVLSEDYSKIDIKKLVDNNKISISKELDEKNSTVEKPVYTYKLKAKASYFPSRDIGKAFIKNVAESPIVKDMAIATSDNFDTNLKSFDESKSFDNKIDYLLQQAKDLMNRYKKYIGTDEQEAELKISDTLIGSVTANYNAVNNIMNDSKASVLKGQVTTYGLAYDYKALSTDSLNSQIAYLNSGKALNQTKIDAINTEITTLGTGAQITALSEELEKLVLENANIQIEIDKLTNQLANVGRDSSSFKEHNDFVKDITDKRTALENCVDSYKVFLNDVYVKDASVVFVDASIIVNTGNINTALCVIIPLLVGAIVAFIVNLIVDRKKLYE